MAGVGRLEVNVHRKVYPGASHAALEGLSFVASGGEFVAIVGPSGAGKSTLLNLVCGLDGDFEGDIRLNGTAPGSRDRNPPRVGVMFQSPRLMPWLSIVDNLRLVLRPGESTDGTIQHLLGQVGLNGWEQAFPNQLSGGMQRRASLARAFAVAPELLLLDEPFVSLDSPTASKMRDHLLDLWQERRCTVLMVTHELREALALADRVLFLSASPARVVLSCKVSLSRPRGPTDPAVAALHDRLLASHPEILSGLAGEVVAEPVVGIRSRCSS